MRPSAEVVPDESLGEGRAGSLAPVVSAGEALVGEAPVGAALVGVAVVVGADVGAGDVPAVVVAAGVGLRCETRVLGDAEVPPGAHAVRSPIASVPPATSAAVRTLITGAV